MLGNIATFALKIMVMLQNVCKNCVRVLEEEKHSFPYLVKEVKETGILIDKTKHENPKIVRTPENIIAVVDSLREAPTPSFSTIKHFGGIIETNFA